MVFDSKGLNWALKDLPNPILLESGCRDRRLKCEGNLPMFWMT
jgi:hypothetical protein